MVNHPGGDGVFCEVSICKGSSPIVKSLEDFSVCSEHYYLHIDPSIEVLAATRFSKEHHYHIANKPIDMPVTWTKLWRDNRDLCGKWEEQRMKMKVALAQLVVTQNIESNLQAILRALRFAKREGVKLLLTPEGSLSGYTYQFDRVQQKRALARVEEEARSLGVGLALGTCQEEADGICYNEQRFYSPEGKYLGCHTKILRCGTMEEPPAGEVNHYGVRPLRTFQLFGITVGGLICNDLWANPGCTPMPDPHLVWQLQRMGARVIFHSVNGGGDGTEFMNTVNRSYHTSNLTLRAKAAGIPIVSVDALVYPGIHPVACPGGVVDGQGRRVYSLPDTGEQFGAYELEID